MNYRFSTSSLICVQINNDLFAVGTGLRISNTFQFLLMDWSYVIVFPRQNDWTSKCHYKASNLTVNQCLILSVCVFKEFECKVKTFVKLWIVYCLVEKLPGSIYSSYNSAGLESYAFCKISLSTLPGF